MRAGLGPHPSVDHLQETSRSESGSCGMLSLCEPGTVEVPLQGTSAWTRATGYTIASDAKAPPRSECKLLFSAAGRHNDAGREAQIGFRSEDHSRLFSESWTIPIGAL